MTNLPFGISVTTEAQTPDHFPFPSAQGKVVYDRTYSRTQPNGERETWFDTVRRVAHGNLAFVHGTDDSRWPASALEERERLIQLMSDFSIIPGGRHLWATGVPGREFVSNCFVSHWTDRLSDHFTFTLLRLAEGGGVGANYSSKHTGRYPRVKRDLTVHITCDPSHPNYQDMKDAGLLSTEYSHEWTGSYAVEDSREGWADALADLLDTFVKDAPVKHQNRVYDMSRIRPKGQPLRTFGGVASGPEPFAELLVRTGRIMSARFEKKLRPLDLMEIDHEIGACVVAGGNRRSARMSIVRWDDPQILDFIKCKQDPSKHWTTNISVEIDDEFIKLVSLESAPVPMGTIVDLGQDAFKRYTKAHKVYRAIITGMLTNGEPGMWNSSLSNEGEPNEVVCTNPCLTGDTVIATINGPKTFAELAEIGEDVQVYSWHPKTKLPVIRWMRRPHKTAENVPVLEVEFDSGLKVRATPDHGFFNFRGKRVEARDLRVGQSVRAWSMSEHRDGHLRVHGWDAKRNAAVHQWVHRMMWENEIGPIPEGMVIDHINGNPQDNRIENFQLLTPEGHNSKHYADRFANGFCGRARNHKVVGIREAGREDVYNGMVEDSHTYVILDPDPIAGIASGIVSANCGEITLNPWESCILGHVNLDNFVPEISYLDLSLRERASHWDSLYEAHRLMTRFLIRATYGTMNDDKQAEVVSKNRRIGVGHFGVQAFLAKQGVAISDLQLDHSSFGYDVRSKGFNTLLAALHQEVREEARRYAFELRIPEPVKTTTIAPTGSIAKMPGTTEGAHPIYSRYFNRRIRFSTVDPKEVVQFESLKAQGYVTEVAKNEKDTVIVVIPTKDKLVAEVESRGIDPSVVEAANEIPLKSMLTLQAIYQELWADNAVSFTVNVPAEEHQNKYFLENPWGTNAPAPTTSRIREVGNTLLEFLPLLKGTTIMVDGTRAQAPYERISREEFEELTGPVEVDDGTDVDCNNGACPVR